MNIKNGATHQLARKLAQATGESLTTAVTIAIRERLDRVRPRQPRASADELLDIGRDCARLLKRKPTDHGEWLYDDRWGLPR